MQSIKIKKKYLKQLLMFFEASIISFSIANELNNKNNQVVSVTSDIRNNLCSNGIISNDFEDDITINALNRLNFLNIDMKNNNNLNVLRYCNNVKEITIDNPELLTEDDIECINKSNIKIVSLNFNIENTINELSYGNNFDLERFIDKVINININTSKETDYLFFFEYLKNYKEFNYCDIDYDKLRLINEKLDIIIENLDIKSEYTDIDKIILISDYILNYLEYDNEIKEMDQKLSEYPTSIQEKVTNYNTNELSSILLEQNDNEIKYGICTNYAYLFHVLCYKVGIKSRIVHGTSVGEDIGHVWNIVYLNDNERPFIDLTSLDNDELSKLLLESYVANVGTDYNDLDYLSQYLFYNTDDYLNLNISIVEDIDSLDKLVNKSDIVYSNEELISKKIDRKVPIIIGINSGIITLYLNSILHKRKNKKLVK